MVQEVSAKIENKILESVQKTNNLDSQSIHKHQKPKNWPILCLQLCFSHSFCLVFTFLLATYGI
jgi:hypothetical protein